MFHESLPIDVRGAFLDISKAFDKGWHKRLSYGISGNLLKLIANYLTNRKQSVILSDQISSYENFIFGVSQISVLGPFFFLIYINDLPDGIQSIFKIFADNTSLFSKSQDFKKSKRELHEDFTSM